MAINNCKEIELNAVEVLKKREIFFLPIHFSSTVVYEYNIHKIKDWIKSKLNGRYCITTVPKITKDDKLKPTTIVAFEDEKELTYFMLACPYTRRN